MWGRGYIRNYTGGYTKKKKKLIIVCIIPYMLLIDRQNNNTQCVRLKPNYLAYNIKNYVTRVFILIMV